MSNKRRVRHNLYMPKHLQKQIKQIAKNEMRSFNKQCLVFLMQGVEQETPGWDSEEKKEK